MSSIKIHAAILTLFGCGKSKYAPGTVGSFATILIWLGFSYLFFLEGVPLWVETMIWALASVAMFYYGIFAVPIYSKSLNDEDHPSIVLDEVLGQVVALALIYPFVKSYYFLDVESGGNLVVASSHITFCFLGFRLLDILKPSIIGKIDRNVKGGFGVMLDDLVCGLFVGGLGVIFFLILKCFN